MKLSDIKVLLSGLINGNIIICEVSAQVCSQYSFSEILKLQQKNNLNWYAVVQPARLVANKGEVLGRINDSVEESMMQVDVPKFQREEGVFRPFLSL